MAKNYAEFRELLQIAIGSDRKKSDFAVAADLSTSHLSRLLNMEIIAKPAISTLEKIAGASCGRVKMDKLLAACGYSNEEGQTSSPYLVFRDVDNPEVQENIMEFKKGIAQFCGLATRYNSLEDVMETVDMLYGKAKFRFTVEEPQKFTGRGHMSAEKYANITVSWGTDEYCCDFGLVAYFCETTGGGIIFSDAAFDLMSLTDAQHPLGAQKLLDISVVENAVISDYQTVFYYKKL